MDLNLNYEIDLYFVNLVAEMDELVDFELLMGWTIDLNIHFEVVAAVRIVDWEHLEAN